MNLDFLAGLAVAIGVVALNAWIRKDAPQRHARFRMRAKLAELVYGGKLHPVRVKKGRIVGVSLRKPGRRSAPQRAKILSVVRRDDQGA